jgi:hypothetical protein
MADYQKLYDALRLEAEADGSNTPHWLRTAFHDLANFNATGNGEGGPRGCIRDEIGRSMPHNSQLELVTRDLNRILHRDVPGVDISFGDVVSLSAKVVVEKAYPCIRIKWRPGRPPCDGKEVANFPPSDMQTLEKLDPFLKNYNFTQNEFALLMAGSHGLALATLHTDKLNEHFFARLNSPKKYIMDALNGAWSIIHCKFERAHANVPFFYKSDTDHGPVVRLPVDMMFYPNSVSEAKSKSHSKKGIHYDVGFNETESYLTTLTSQSDFTVKQEFGKVLEKMLEIGLSKEMLDSTPFFPDSTIDDSLDEVQQCKMEPF